MQDARYKLYQGWSRAPTLRVRRGGYDRPSIHGCVITRQKLTPPYSMYVRCHTSLQQHTRAAWCTAPP
ncbi:hypothetical protein COCCADRAFT_94244 [Bipolaris zeicola 26-R-13]|uniref:Uncharacterized protein n=1 Tax=Cochliobolus carbonum (strain 26-R-13) TaxID=930089 RepID=W6Y385_COCC2|nr:uncharacterized protein COCCADRAFT_94244 [Bipolaris zeicola 26-R-13]EUC34142.1 hypothetical protein COCCADRAFT_94244 [Bipolaris zeicola 26-R-13]